MNIFRLSFRMLRRDWRAGELRVLTFALVIAIGGMTTVGFFADRVQLALSRQGNQLLGKTYFRIGSFKSPNQVSQVLGNGRALPDIVHSGTSSL